MAIEANKAVVRRFFDEVLDQGKTDLMLELFAPDCVIHFNHLPKPHVGNAAYAAALAPGVRQRSRFETTIQHLIAEGDLVAARIHHTVTYTGDVTTRIGKVPAAGKTITWTANVFFRFEDGRIAEEWIERDEAGMLQQLGVLTTTGS
jgi:steroid delta-isomerase-like uncharacterized protein